MRITLNQAQIEQGLRLFIASQGFNTEGKTIEIDLKATRGPEGYTADINIPDASGGTATAVPAAKPLQIEKKVAAAKAEEPEAKEVTAAEEPPFTADDVATNETAEPAVEEAEEAPEPSTRKSLFGDAKRPVNA